MRGLIALYDIVASIAAIFIIPKLLWDYFFHKKYHGILWEKLGVVLPDFKPSDKPLLWIHAVSLGEFKAISYLIQIWRKELPQLRIFVTHGTLTGYTQAEKEFGSNIEHAILPIDLPFNSKRLVKLLNPKILVCVESDLWPGYLVRARNQGCHCYVVNAKFSDLSAQRIMSLRPLLKPLLFDPIEYFLLKSPHEVSFLKSMQVRNFSITGNIKWDHPYVTPSSVELEGLRHRLALSSKAKLVTAASTHSGEEAILLDALKQDLRAGKFQLVIIPRHPERFDRVKALVQSKGYDVFTYKEALTLSDEVKKKAQVIVIDAMGIVMECYALSKCALVGGSWVNIGGHNILEPLRLGIPTFYGPYMHQQLEMHEMAQRFDAAQQIPSSGLKETIEKTLLCNESVKKHCDNAEKMLSSCSGAIAKTDRFLRNDWRKKEVIT